MGLWQVLLHGSAEEHLVNKMYWLSGALAGVGCTLMTVSVVGLALI